MLQSKDRFIESYEMRADVNRFSLADPSDASGLRNAIESGRIKPEQVVCVIGKTHGNGLVNDYTRGYLSLSLARVLGACLGEPPEAVLARVPFVFSGGVEGVLSPHYSVFTVDPDGHGQSGKSLAVGVAFTREATPSQIGAQAQIEEVATAVRDAMAKAGIDDVADVHLVQVKGPAFSAADIENSRRAGKTCLSGKPGELMALGRAASALGVGLALGEIEPANATADRVLSDFGIYSSVASISAGAEIRCNEVIVLGMSERWSGDLHIDHELLQDAIDLAGVTRLARRMGFTLDSQLSEKDTQTIRAAFVKCEPQRDGTVRGRAHTMLNDGDIDAQRHIRGAVGGMVAGVLGETALFVSGGAEHQGPCGGGLIALIAEKRAANA
jgi:cyanuric acid amidohydrolase